MTEMVTAEALAKVVGGSFANTMSEIMLGQTKTYCVSGLSEGSQLQAELSSDPKRGNHCHAAVNWYF